MSLHLITAPARRPVTLIEAKAHCRVDSNISDAKIDQFIEAATSDIDGRDGWLGRCLVEQTWELRLHCFTGVIEIPLPPYRSITSVKYLDTAGVEQTVTSTAYDVIPQDPGPTLIQPAYGLSWPSARYQPNAIRVRFVAGYASVSSGALTGTIPAAIIGAMLTHIQAMHDNRSVCSMPDDAMATLTKFCTSWV